MVLLVYQVKLNTRDGIALTAQTDVVDRSLWTSWCALSGVASGRQMMLYTRFVASTLSTIRPPARLTPPSDKRPSS